MCCPMVDCEIGESAEEEQLRAKEVERDEVGFGAVVGRLQRNVSSFEWSHIHQQARTLVRKSSSRIKGTSTTGRSRFAKSFRLRQACRTTSSSSTKTAPVVACRGSYASRAGVSSLLEGP